MGIDARSQSHRRTDGPASAVSGRSVEYGNGRGTCLTDGNSIVATLHASSLAHIETFFLPLHLSYNQDSYDKG